jgi:hypothetical protein
MERDWVSTLLPLAILGIVFAFRFRSLSKPRPFKPGRLWIAPALLAGLVCFMVATMPPAPSGWAALAFGLVLGAALGWKRGHLMHLEREPLSGGLLIRQSPAALLFILGIVAARRLFSAGVGIDPGQPGADGAIPASALVLTDGMLGLALGMVAAMRWTLWQRAKSVAPHSSSEG